MNARSFKTLATGVLCLAGAGMTWMVLGDEEIEFEAPCTLVAPRDVPHQYWNTGDIETDAIVIIGIGSKIWNQDGELMDLPWRK